MCVGLLGLTGFACVARRRLKDRRRDLIEAAFASRDACPPEIRFIGVNRRRDGHMIVIGMDTHKGRTRSLL